jgi:hypothetical protein
MNANEIRNQKFKELFSSWLKIMLLVTFISLVGMLLTVPKPGWEIVRFFVAPGAVTILCLCMEKPPAVKKRDGSTVPLDLAKFEKQAKWSSELDGDNPAPREFKSVWDALTDTPEEAARLKKYSEEYRGVRDVKLSFPAFIKQREAERSQRVRPDEEAAARKRRLDDEEEERLRRAREANGTFPDMTQNLFMTMMIVNASNSSAANAASAPTPSPAPAPEPTPICRDDRVYVSEPPPPPAPAPSYESPAPSPSYDSGSSSSSYDSGSSSSSSSDSSSW